MSHPPFPDYVALFAKFVLLALLSFAAASSGPMKQLVQGRKVMVGYAGAHPGGLPSIDPNTVPTDPNVDVIIALSFARDLARDGTFHFYPGMDISPALVAQSKNTGRKIMISLGGSGWAWERQGASLPSWQMKAVSSLDALLSQYSADGVDLDYEDSADWSEFAAAWCHVIQQIKIMRPNLLVTFAPFPGTDDAAYKPLYATCGNLVSWTNYQLYAAPYSSAEDLLSSASSSYGGLVNIALGLCTNAGDRRGTVDDEHATALVSSHSEARGVFIWSLEDSAQSGYALERSLLPILSGSESQ